MSLACGHSYCNDCIVRAVGAQTTANKTCPSCRTTIADLSFRISITINAIISKTKVRCSISGCPWTGEHHEKEAHQYACEFCERNCPYGCVGNFILRSVLQHLQICPYKRINCQYCLMKVARFCAKAHEENCPQAPRPCPLGCDKTLSRLGNICYLRTKVIRFFVFVFTFCDFTSKF